MEYNIDLESIWWEDEWMFIPHDSSVIKLYKPYLSSIKFEGLECENPTDDVTIIGSNKCWN